MFKSYEATTDLNLERLLEFFVGNPIGMFIHNNLFPEKLRGRVNKKHRELVQKAGRWIGTYDNMHELLQDENLPTDIKEDVLNKWVELEEKESTK